MATNFSENSETQTLKYVCSLCDYKCCKKQHYKQHCDSAKHKKRIGNTLATNFSENSALECDVCCRRYKDRTGLWKHKKKCIEKTDDTKYMTVISTLISDNKELRNFVMEQSKVLTEQRKETSEIMNKVIEMVKPSVTTINNNDNKSFNINVFLNEKCKDAINFTDFIKNIEISRQDLENNAQLGFVSGISKIFLDNLKQLGVNERPFHCTDTKRETMYIKDEDKWTKEVDDSKLQKAIQTVSYRSIGKLQEWKQENPEYQDVNSEFSEKCLDMQRNTIAGSNREVYYPKVIHVLAKETMVDK
jgi:hypothetical protein